MLEIKKGLCLADEELRFEVSHSSGPGGQNVNKVATRVALCFDVPASSSLTQEQKDRILSKLSSRLTKHGVLRVVAQRSRTQLANRTAATWRLAELLDWALTDAPARRATRATLASRTRRLDSKRRRASLKSARSAPSTFED